MSIPALDGVNSAKHGIAQSQTATLLCRLHDDGVESEHMRRTTVFRRPAGYLIRTDPGTGVVMEEFYNQINEYDLLDQSQGFERELAFLHNSINPETETPEREELDFDSCSDTEEEILKAITSYINQDSISSHLFHDFLQNAYRNREYETHDMEFVPNQNRPFSEGDYSSQGDIYLPKVDRVDDPVLYLNSGVIEQKDGTEAHLVSLWVRYQTSSESAEERPLVFSTDDEYIQYSNSPSYGGPETPEALTDEFEQAIHAVATGENPQTVQLTEAEQTVISILTSTDLTDTQTREYLRQLTG